MLQPPLSKPLTDVQTQFLKMTTVVQQIQTVLYNIYLSQSLPKQIYPQIFKSFLHSLTLTISTLHKFSHSSPQSQTPTPSNKKSDAFSKISQCLNQSQLQNSLDPIQIHSQILPNQLFQSKLSVLDRDMTDVKMRNKELREENQYLEEKLSEAEKYIRKIQEINEGLLSEGFRGRRSSLSDLARGREREDKSRVVRELMEEMEVLKQQLRQSQQFIDRSNKQFIKQIQRKDQKLWKLQKQLSFLKSNISQSQSGKNEQQFIINKLKQENFRLEVMNRNLKITTTTPLKAQKSSKVFEQLLKDRVATATSLDIQGAFKKKI